MKKLIIIGIFFASSPSWAEDLPTVDLSQLHQGHSPQGQNQQLNQQQIQQLRQISSQVSTQDLQKALQHLLEAQQQVDKRNKYLEELMNEQ